MNINKKQAAIYAGVLFLGVAIGTGGNKTKTVTVEKPVEVIRNVEVFKTPQACIDLKDIDNSVFTSTGEFFGNISAAANTGSTTLFIASVTKETEALTTITNSKKAARMVALEGCK